MPFAAVFSAALVWGLIWYPFRVLEETGVSGALSTSVTYLIAMLFGAFMLPRIWNELRNAGGWIVLLMVSVGWANLGNVLAVLEGEVAVPEDISLEEDEETDFPELPEVTTTLQGRLG
jgi:hypothetical protein